MKSVLFAITKRSAGSCQAYSVENKAQNRVVASPNTVTENLQVVSRVDLKCSIQEKEIALTCRDAGVRYGGNHLFVYQINPLYILNSHMLYVNYISMRLEKMKIQKSSFFKLNYMQVQPECS